MAIKLANNAGEALSVTSAQITNDADPPMSCTLPATPLDWEAGTTLDITFTGCSQGGLLAGERVEAKVRLLYYAVNTPSQPVHQISGRISGRGLSS